MILSLHNKATRPSSLYNVSVFRFDFAENALNRPIFPAQQSEINMAPGLVQTDTFHFK